MNTQTIEALAPVLQKHLDNEVVDVLFSRCVLYDKLEENVGATAFGNNKLEIAIRTARTGAVGGYKQDSDIPAFNAKHDKAVASIKMITGRYTADERLLQQVQNKNTSAIVTYIDEQKETLGEQYKRTLQSMIYGDASEDQAARTLGVVAADVPAGLVVTIEGEDDRDMTEHITPGMHVQIGSITRIVDEIVDGETFTVTANIPTTTVEAGDVIRQVSEDGELTEDVTGLKTIIDDGNTYLGIDRTQKSWFKSQVENGGNVTTTNVEGKLRDLKLKQDKFRKKGEDMMLITNQSGWRTYSDAMINDRQFVKPEDGKYNGGVKALYLDGYDAQLILDYDAPTNEIFGILPSALSWGTQGDLGKKMFHLDRGGAIFRPINKRTSYEVITGMFLELYSRNPRALGKLEDITWA